MRYAGGEQFLLPPAQVRAGLKYQVTPRQAIQRLEFQQQVLRHDPRPRARFEDITPREGCQRLGALPGKTTGKQG